MFETMVGFVLGDHLGGLTFEPPLDDGGYARQLSPDRAPYQTARRLHLRAGLQRQAVEELLRGDRPRDLRNDPRFCTFADRAANIDEVYAELARIFATRTTAEWTDAARARPTSR